VTRENTKARALDEARALMQTYGFAGFTFQQVAKELGIKQPSLYAHFKSKEHLGQMLIKEYIEGRSQWMSVVRVFEPKDKINAFFESLCEFCADGRKLCPLSSLISDYNSLPKSLKRSLDQVFELERNWLNELIAEGQGKKAFRKDKSSMALADHVMFAILGGQLAARVSGDPEKIRRVKEQVLEGLMVQK
jgi:TetR/AcrR family transcriptional regulator, transcriptional repressor for nem operon